MNTTSDIEGNRAWYAVQVWTGREPACADHLRARGYGIFQACYQEHRRWSDRVKHVERALFPGYLFCQIQPDTVGKVISSPGVIRIVGDGRQPIPVEPHEIDAIRRIVSAGIGAEPYKQLAAGQRIRLTGGPLNGVVGIVVRTATRNRFVVSISLLQRAVAVEIDASWISVVPTVPSELDAVHGAQRGRCYHGLQ